jgi:hypothetical protein
MTSPRVVNTLGSGMRTHRQGMGPCFGNKSQGEDPPPLGFQMELKL